MKQRRSVVSTIITSPAIYAHFQGLFTDVFVAVVLIAHRSFGMSPAVLRVWMPSTEPGRLGRL